MKKSLLACMALGLCASVISPVKAEETSLFTSIIANTKVGDGALVVTSFDIEVNDAEAIKDLKAEDFDITGNTSSRVLDAEKGGFVQPYEDDGIVLSIDGTKIHMEVEPFKFNAEWSVACQKEGLGFAPADVKEDLTLTLDEAERGSYEGAGLNRQYALYVPKNEDGTKKKNVPIVIWNHGGGEYAGDIEATLQANRGLTAWNEDGFECAVLMIQVSNENYSYGAANDEEKKKLIDQNNALQMTMVRDLIAEGTVDPDRVYVTGASSGGGATMRFAMQFADELAGAIACCSMDPIVHIHHNPAFEHDAAVKALEEAWQSNVYTWDEEKKEMVEKKIDTKALLDLPIMFTHAENDPVCNVESSKCYYESMANLGDTNNRLEIWSDDDMKEYHISNDATTLGAAYLLHWSWVRMLDDNSEAGAKAWLFNQKKSHFTGFELNDGTPYYTVSEDKALYWYENGVRQGVEGDPKNVKDKDFGEIERGREIYDPNSDAWYWLDANADGAVAKNKEVWMPYVYQSDLAAGLNPDGKWVRYDKYGQMIKGWYACDAGVYYYDKGTGKMFYGEHVINGKSYKFDAVTGIMK